MKKALAIAGLVLLGGCFKLEPAVVVRVAIKLLPAEGGATFVEIDSTGRVRGGRMGVESAFVTQDTASIPEAEARAIFDAARALGDTLLQRVDANIVEPPGSTVLAVLYNDRSQARIIWPSGTPHPDERVNALEQRLLAHRVAW